MSRKNTCYSPSRRLKFKDWLPKRFEETSATALYNRGIRALGDFALKHRITLSQTNTPFPRFVALPNGNFNDAECRKFLLEVDKLIFKMRKRWKNWTIFLSNEQTIVFWACGAILYMNNCLSILSLDPQFEKFLTKQLLKIVNKYNVPIPPDVPEEPDAIETDPKIVPVEVFPDEQRIAVWEHLKKD